LPAFSQIQQFYPHIHTITKLQILSPHSIIANTFTVMFFHYL
jgi:hypothetical protein